MEEDKKKLIKRLSYLYELTMKFYNLEHEYVEDLLYVQIINATDEDYLKAVEQYIESSIDNLENPH